MARTNSLPRKRRTRQHVIADLSVNHVERYVLRTGNTIERIVHDYGIDLVEHTYTADGEPEAGGVLIQMKAIDQFRPAKQGKALPFRIDRKDLVRWLQEWMPVVLIVYDAEKDIAYWLYVQSHFRAQKDFNLFTAGAKITVRISLDNVVNEDAIGQFSGFRDRILSQVTEVEHHE